MVVGKQTVDGRTTTNATVLDADARAAELAAMLGGASSGTEARAAAEALLREAAGAPDRG